MKRRNELNMKAGCRHTYALPSELQNWIIHQKPTRRRIGDGIAAPRGSSCGGGGVSIYMYVYIYICISLSFFLLGIGVESRPSGTWPAQPPIVVMEWLALGSQRKSKNSVVGTVLLVASPRPRTLNKTQPRPHHAPLGIHTTTTRARNRY